MHEVGREVWLVPPKEPFDLASYYPIFIYLAIILGMCASILVLCHVVGPRKKTPVKQMTYESGMDPIGTAHQRFDVKFYLVAISFLVFDVELLILYPWAVIAYRENNGLPAELRATMFVGVLLFIGLLAVAYLYDWRKGVFKWR